MDAPHFALPFRLDGSSFAAVEQDTPEEIACCVEAVLRTRPGERDELPGFGSPDLTFHDVPLDTRSLVDAVRAWEPRAEALADDAPAHLDATARRVHLTLTLED